MIQIKDGKVLQTTLPTAGVLSDGRSVSNYHVLPEAILKAEGWLPEEEVKPLFDSKTEQLVFDKYEVLKSKVKVIYKAETLPEPIPDPVQILRAEVDALKSILVVKEIITMKEKDLL